MFWKNIWGFCNVLKIVLRYSGKDIGFGYWLKGDGLRHYKSGIGDMLYWKNYNKDVVYGIGD